MPCIKILKNGRKYDLGRETKCSVLNILSLECIQVLPVMQKNIFLEFKMNTVGIVLLVAFIIVCVLLVLLVLVQDDGQSGMGGVSHSKDCPQTMAQSFWGNRTSFPKVSEGSPKGEEQIIEGASVSR